MNAYSLQRLSRDGFDSFHPSTPKATICSEILEELQVILLTSSFSLALEHAHARHTFKE